MFPATSHFPPTPQITTFKSDAVSLVSPATNKRSINHELPVNSMQDCFQILVFSLIFRIKQIKQPQNERMVDVPFSKLRIRFR
ncbi:hypothetical protein HanRHA438_Chr15g0687241 [Helianthus annuus]|nr:hypothetical protein HanLR1_Chr15g0560471 [Helianthus annuus]KAJ0843062.1 hypothetical protein HanRHA438_Chr15g0687241 [Helianthus annuus]